MEDLVILGAGGYAKQVFLIAKRLGRHKIVGFYDETIKEDSYYMETPVRSDLERLVISKKNTKLICAVGNIELRMKWVHRFSGHFEFTSIVDPSCIVFSDASIGTNVVILGYSIVSAGAVVEDHVNINWQSLVSHGAHIGKFSNIASGVKVTGSAKVGAMSEIGTNAAILPDKSVGDLCIIGAGAIVAANIPSRSVAMGIPAKVVKSREQ